MYSFFLPYICVCNVCESMCTCDQVANNPRYYRILPLYFQALREAHPRSMFDIEFDNEGHFERAIIVFDAVRDMLGYLRNVSAIDAGHSKHVSTCMC